MRFSALKVFTQGLTGNRGWRAHWRDPEPAEAYDIVIIGGGGHGLSTAYYLAKEHGLRRIAVLEKGYIGGGNIGRNTTIVRANYFLPGNSEFYSHSLKLWEGLELDLNYNVMHSQRGQIGLFHSDGQRDAAIRRANSIRNQGDDAELLSVAQLRRMVPYLDYDQGRFPIYGGLLQRRAGTARHDAVAWGYARGADSRGVDIIQNCEVKGITSANGVVTGVETTKGYIGTKKIGIVVAGHSGQVADMAGFRLPVEAVALGALRLTPGVTVKDVLQRGVSLRCWDQRSAEHRWHPLFLPGQPWPSEQPLTLRIGCSRPQQTELELVLGEPQAEERSEVVFVNGLPVLRRQSAGTAAVEAWAEQPTPIPLTPAGEPGSDRLELRFAINSRGELTVEGCDLSNDQPVPQQRLGSVR